MTRAAAGNRSLWQSGAILALAMALTLAALWLVTRDAVVCLSFGGGIVVLGALGWLLLRTRPEERAPEFGEPDWSVTVAALDLGERAVAVMDRAGRLVCANAAYDQAFGQGAPPASLVQGAGEDMARAAWRDGGADGGWARGGDGQRWSVCVTRAGRGDAWLIWHFDVQTRRDMVSDIAGYLTAKPGRALSQAGFCAAVVGAEGRILAANDAFVLRATGEAQGTLAGTAFVDHLAQDEHDHIFWLRDTRCVAPLTLFYVPLADPDSAPDPDPSRDASLMVLVDHGVGLGGGGGDSGNAVPHLEALLAGLPLGLAMADRDGHLLFANPAFMRAAGREGAATPTYPTDLVVQEDKAALSDAIRRFGHGPATSGDVAIRLAAQPDDPVSLSIAGVRGLGEAAVLLGLTDTTEETRLKRQVAQATKMQAVGQLAGGVAHDFNNVLTAIIGTCDLMLLRHTPGDSDYDDIQQIRANSNRAASLTRQLLAFSRQQTLRPEVLQLPDIVSEISQMLRRLIGEKITLEVTHDRDLGAVRADPTQLEQVIVNLAVNARDAIQDHARKVGGDGAGRLALTTRRVTAAQVRAMRSEILPVADYTALVVEDTGGGIPTEILGKIWEPFFTTKEKNRGTGLGLSTVYGIVKQSGGFIFAESEPGVGTRFTLYLPVHHELPGQSAPPRLKDAPVATAWAGGGDILLVEDEDAVRVVAQRALTRAGYQVTTASDGEEGLDQVQARRESGEAMFDLIVSDVVMPILDGPAMARAVRVLVPDVPVLFMSGYAEEQLRRDIDIDNMHFMPKPFSVNQIGEKVASILAAKGAEDVVG
ncbi:MAG: response regulator [Sphingomonadales bacterium]|nr:response regulator [Sphingomonadales bacterium]MDE2169506.1 response regulator [Sphingomonadales bacterium]